VLVMHEPTVSRINFPSSPLPIAILTSVMDKIMRVQRQPSGPAGIRAAIGCRKAVLVQSVHLHALGPPAEPDDHGVAYAAGLLRGLRGRAGGGRAVRQGLRVGARVRRWGLRA